MLLASKLTKYFLQAASTEEESDESVSSMQRNQRKTTATKTTPTRRAPTTETVKKTARSASSDSSASTESSSTPVHTGAAYTAHEVKQKYLSRGSTDHGTEPSQRTRMSSTGSNTGKVSQNLQQKFYPSRVLSNKTSTPAPPVNKDEEETETSSEEETESEEESEDNTSTKVESKEMAKTDIGPLLARSAQARDNSAESNRRNSRDDTTSYGRSRYGTPKEETPTSKYSRTRPTHEDEPKYGYTSRFLNKSKSSALVPDDEDHSKYGTTAHNDDADSKYPSGRSRYMALKERRQRLARSKSSHNFGDDDDVDEPISPTSSNPSAYLASRGYGSTTSGNDLARSRSTHALKSRENSPDRSGGTEKDGAALSSWARYLKNKYGNRSTNKDKDSTTSTASPSSSSAAARRLSLGLPLRSSTELGSSDDDQKNMQGSPTTPTAAMAAAGKFLCIYYCNNNLH